MKGFNIIWVYNPGHNKVLMCLRRKAPYKGLYNLVGGKVEPGEAPRQALIRELAEEISLEVNVGQEVPPPTDLGVPSPSSGAQPDDDAPAWPVLNGYRMRVWLAEPRDPARGPELGTAHETMHWVPLHEVEALPWLSADLPILRAVGAVLACGPRF